MADRSARSLGLVFRFSGDGPWGGSAAVVRLSRSELGGAAGALPVTRASAPDVCWPARVKRSASACWRGVDSRRPTQPHAKAGLRVGSAATPPVYTMRHFPRLARNPRTLRRRLSPSRRPWSGRLPWRRLDRGPGERSGTNPIAGSAATGAIGIATRESPGRGRPVPPSAAVLSRSPGTDGGRIAAKRGARRSASGSAGTSRLEGDLRAHDHCPVNR
jgi:hypothetical protein